MQPRLFIYYNATVLLASFWLYFILESQMSNTRRLLFVMKKETVFGLLLIAVVVLIALEGVLRTYYGINLWPERFPQQTSLSLITSAGDFTGEEIVLTRHKNGNLTLGQDTFHLADTLTPIVVLQREKGQEPFNWNEFEVPEGVSLGATSPSGKIFVIAL
jgi:hypothetical protein